jgi:glycerophosphoryl diester phosphodiesterase
MAHPIVSAPPVPLPAVFLRLPLAHRALHDLAAGRPENSRAALSAAIDAGYGAEIDLQLSADGVAMVFHDDTLDRLTAETGPVASRSAADLAAIALNGGSEGIPTLSDVLALVAGRIPLLIEIKDQDGRMGPNVGALERATAAALQGYDGPVALMSFNPHSVAAIGQAAPHLPRGLTTSAYDPEDWAPLPKETCDRLRDIPDFISTGASFLSHEWQDLTRPRVQALRAAGTPVLCWTIKSRADETLARQKADNITFEHYRAALPPA